MKRIIPIVLVLLVVLPLASADKIKLETTAVANLAVGDTFEIIVSYYPEGGTEITELRFDVVDAPRIGVDVATDGILFTSAQSAQLLNPGAANGNANGGTGYWEYLESSAENALGCEGDATCKGTINQYNEIMRISAEVTALPDAGGISISFDEATNFRFFDGVTGGNIVPTVEYDNNELTFAAGGGGGDVCDAEHLALCTTQAVCTPVAFWYDEADGDNSNDCYAACPQGTNDGDDNRVCESSCALDNLAGCTTSADCVALPSFWFDDHDDATPNCLVACPAGRIDDDADFICTPQLGQNNPVCGDDRVEGTEQCDDGNVIDGDGCSSTCRHEDTDGDSVTDNVDNCPAVANADQADADGDGTGDACEDAVGGTLRNACLADNTCTSTDVQKLTCNVNDNQCYFLGDSNHDLCVNQEDVDATDFAAGNIDDLNALLWGMHVNWGQCAE